MKGATGDQAMSRTVEVNFNPRSREGSDPTTQRLAEQMAISIHAPVKGAT